MKQDYCELDGQGQEIDVGRVKLNIVPHSTGRDYRVKRDCFSASSRDKEKHSDLVAGRVAVY